MQTDYLQFVQANAKANHQVIAPLIKKALQHANTTEIVDLCSGGVGPWIYLQARLAQIGWPVSVKLTDKYPHPDALAGKSIPSNAVIEYLAEPVDAMDVPVHLTGMRTLFEGSHHFPPNQARMILRDAADQHAAIGLFEATLARPGALLLSPLLVLMTLLAYLFVTPSFKPRSFSRILWTYLVPVVPLTTCWDGIVSFLRVYLPPELKALTDSIPSDDYTWEIGQMSTQVPAFTLTYLLGYPKNPGSLPA